MGIRGLFEGWHIVILAIVLVVLFGAKRLPDASRSVGRSLKIFKSEMKDLTNNDDDEKPRLQSGTTTSETHTQPVETVRTETVETRPVTPASTPVDRTPVDHPRV